MHAPIVIITLGEILMRMRAAAFFASLCSYNGRHGVGHQIGELQSFHEIRIPHQAAVGHFNIAHFICHGGHLIDPICQGLRGAEHRRIRLHSFLHL